MEKTEFARIYGFDNSEVKKLADLCRKAQKLGLSAEPEVGMVYLTDMPIGCNGDDVFIIIDNMLYDQHLNVGPERSPLGDETLVPSWDQAYSWARENGWKLTSAIHDDEIIITLLNGTHEIIGKSRTGQVAMLDAAVKAVELSLRNSDNEKITS